MRSSAFLSARLLLSLLLCTTTRLVAMETIVDLNYGYQQYKKSNEGRSSNNYSAEFGFSEHWDNWSFDSQVSASNLAETDYVLFDDRLFIERLSMKHSFIHADVILGRQDLRFGRASFVNPTDFFDPRDYRDVLLSGDRRLPTDALHVIAYVEQTQYSVTLSPRKGKSYMPHTDSRWFFDLPVELNTGGGENIPLRYSWRNYDDGETDFSDPQYLLRFERTLKQASFSLSYFSGIDNMPVFEPSAPSLDAGGALIVLDQIYPDKSAIGLDLEVSLGLWVLRMEAAQIELTAKGREVDRYQHYVVGFDAKFNDGLFGKETYVAIEFSKQYSDVIDRYDREDIRHLFKNMLFVKLDIDLDSFHVISLDGIYDPQDHQSVAMLSWQHLLSDQLTIEWSADFIRGRPETFFGQYQDNDRISLSVEYAF